MANAEVHTVPNPKGEGWSNELAGHTVSSHSTKEEAVKNGRELAMLKHTEHKIHNDDGTVGETNSYGTDPHTPKVDSYPPKGQNR